MRFVHPSSYSQSGRTSQLTPTKMPPPVGVGLAFQPRIDAMRVRFPVEIGPASSSEQKARLYAGAALSGGGPAGEPLTIIDESADRCNIFRDFHLKLTIRHLWVTILASAGSLFVTPADAA